MYLGKIPAKISRAAFLPDSTVTKSTASPVPRSLYRPSCEGSVGATVPSRPSTPQDRSRALQTCPAPGPPSHKPHSIQQESQNHWGRFTSAGNTNVTGARPELCDSLPRNKHNHSSCCAQGRREKHTSAGQLLSYKVFRQTLFLAPCHPTHGCSAVATHTPLLPIILLCSAHTTFTHPYLGKTSVCLPSPPPHTPIPPTLDKEGLYLADNISRIDLFQGKPHTDLTAKVTAEFKLPNNLNRGNGMPVQNT